MTARAVDRRRSISRGHIHKILSNPIYVGRIAHKGQATTASTPIVPQDLWDQSSNVLAIVRGAHDEENAPSVRGCSRKALRRPRQPDEPWARKAQALAVLCLAGGSAG